MATYLNGITDSRPEQHLYQPDFQFLTSVMGSEQAKYDAGFAKTKNVYNSLLNSPVTNQQNQQFRDETFKKLETQLRAVSKVDLRQASNVSKAKGIFDPLVNDPDLVQDMRLTSQISGELAKADAAMNSADPAVRATYSELSRRDIQNAKDDLQTARRGDGSIQRVRPNAFTAFEDVNVYLDKQAKDQGFKVVRDRIKGPYLVKTTNGAETVPLFSQWSQQAMGSRFDRQFEVEARVGVESGIRSLMRQGQTREQATQAVVQQLHPALLESSHQQVRVTSSKLDELNVHLDNLRREADAHNGLRESQVPAFTQLVTERNALQAELQNHQTDAQTLGSAQATQFLSNNLQGVLSQKVKQKTADDWAKTHAILTAEEEIRPDQIWIHRDTERNTNMRHGQDLNQRAQFKTADLRMDQAKLQQAAQFKQGDWSLEGQKLEESTRRWENEQGIRQGMLDIRAYEAGLKADNSGPGGAAGKSKLALGAAGLGISINGAYTAADQHIAGVDVIHNARNENFGRMYSNSFGMSNSLANVFYTKPDELVALNGLASKLKQWRDGAQPAFTPADVKTLTTFGERFHVQVAVPQNASYADRLLQNMTTGMARRAESQLRPAGTYSRQASQAHVLALAGQKAYAEGGEELEKALVKVSSIIDDGTGHPKDAYKDAVYIGKGADGRALWDASGLPADVKASLNQAVDQKYLNQTSLTGTSYTVAKPEVNLLQTALTPNSIRAIKVNGEDVTADFAAGKGGLASVLKTIPGNTLQKTIGESATFNVNPANNTSTFVFNIDGSAALANGSKTAPLPRQGQVEVTMSNEKILANPDLSRYWPAIRANTHVWSPAAILTNLHKGQPGKAPTGMRNQGFDYTVAETDSGNGPETYVQFTMKNPVPGQPDITPAPTLIPGSLSDPKNAQRVDQHVSEVYQQYTNSYDPYLKQAQAKERRIQLSDPSLPK